MGQASSQQVDRFVSNYVKTSFLSSVISKYATRTDSVVRNVQDFSLDLDARNIRGDIRVFQSINSVINMEQLTNRADQTELTNDIQQAVETELRAAIERFTDGFADIFARPANQQIKDTVLNNLDTAVSNVITTETVDELLLSSDNIQNQRIVITADDITGDLVFKQDIQASIVSRNLTELVINRLLENKDVQELATVADEQIQEEAVSPITEAVRTIGNTLFSGLNLVLLAVIAIIVIAGILLALFLPIGGIWRLLLAGTALVGGLLGGFLLYRRVANSLRA